jgi:voltage-gated potassium channel
LRKGVLKKVFDLDNSEDEEDFRHDHSYIYMMLHPRCRKKQAQIFKKLITSVIIFDLVTFILSTEQSIYVPNILLFHILEGITSTIFFIEYITRLVTVTENQRYGKLGPLLGRLKWMVTPPAIIDFMATIPFFINVAIGWKIPSLSYTRIFRVMRILKTDGYVRAFGACYRVLYWNREILYVALLVCFFLVLVSSVLLFYCRPRNKDLEMFQSIPATLYTSLLMLTGQDALIRSSASMPWYTKMVVGLTGALSVAMFALPVSLLTWGFESEAIRCARRTHRSLKRAGTFETHDDMTSLTKVHSVNSDEEYLKIIAKESSSDGGSRIGAKEVSDESKKKVTELVERFLNDDEHGTKFIALSNFLMSNIEYKEEDDRSFVENLQETMEVSDNDIQLRVGNLEDSVHSLHLKLDSLVQLLEIRGREVPATQSDIV